MPAARPNPVSALTAPRLRYLVGYPAALVAQAQALIDEGRLGDSVRRRYPEPHELRSDNALYEHVQALKNRHMRNAPPLSKVAYDSKLKILQQALGTHTMVSRVQGTQLKAKREIRIASLFKEAPAAFLQMIVVHELAHLREREHDKAFYALCTHMEPAYHQLEFDTRLWLTALECEAPNAAAPGRHARVTRLA
ncbi:YgjP-like metallopeptidase domain-containing protein [Ideonella sp. DXS29W]|uniref:YgjP-like metallopeptidase domain-containing protein n=1 Tax=Ideonella lacteola TaxID=2984193 RepID=A0ABU9BNZ8_9BURK